MYDLVPRVLINYTMYTWNQNLWGRTKKPKLLPSSRGESYYHYFRYNFVIRHNLYMKYTNFFFSS